MPDEFANDVFSSHSAKNKAVVRATLSASNGERAGVRRRSPCFAERLQKDGLRVWFDEWVLKPGDSIPAKIKEGLEHSRVLGLCMSGNVIGSDRKELESSAFWFIDVVNRERRAYPFRIEDALSFRFLQAIRSCMDISGRSQAEIHEIPGFFLYLCAHLLSNAECSNSERVSLHHS